MIIARCYGNGDTTGPGGGDKHERGSNGAELLWLGATAKHEVGMPEASSSPSEASPHSKSLPKP
jgi:hypothetical protein